ncbi:MAG: hypothetical protein KDC53_07310 [Saprospiraceae bacterium]|nr:hypothetical protein [Saprospiraceae bacterium]
MRKLNPKRTFPVSVLVLFSWLSIFSQTISFSPNSGERGGTSFGVTVTGTGVSFVTSTTSCVQIFAQPSTLSLTNVQVTGSSSLTGTLNIPLTHEAGTYDARVYQGPGCTGPQYDCTNCFTVLHPACLTVTMAGSDGTGSLREAFGCASSGDTIRFATSLNNTTIYLATPTISNANDLILFNDASNNVTISSLQYPGNTTPFITTSGDLSIFGLKFQGNDPEPLIFKIDPGGAIDFNTSEINLLTIQKD